MACEVAELTQMGELPGHPEQDFRLVYPHVPNNNWGRSKFQQPAQAGPELRWGAPARGAQARAAPRAAAAAHAAA